MIIYTVQSSEIFTTNEVAIWILTFCLNGGLYFLMGSWDVLL